jgi:hypothetical protein
MNRRLFIMAIAIICMIIFISYPGLNSQSHAQGKEPEQKITVLNPLGTPPSIQLRPMAPRLDTLEGKTIYIVDDGYIGGDNLLLEMVDWFVKEMPRTKVIFRKKGGWQFDVKNPTLWAEMKEKADAMIIGMGH